MLMPHKNNSPFFKRNYKDWSLSEYLSFRHRPRLSPRQILDGWKKSLSNISTCTSPSCCTDNERFKATELLARYEELGHGSDNYLGKSWLAQKTRDTPPVAAIHFGPVYQGPVLNASFTQTNHSPKSSQTNSDPNDETYEPSDYEDLASNIGIDQNDDSELEKDPVTEVSIDKDKGLSAARAAFMDTYTAMDEDHTWLLASGRIVEDIIFKACNAMDDEEFANSLAQSFVIDVTDITMERWFEEEDWADIQSCILPLPKPDVLMIESMRRFLCVNTTDELRNVLRTTDYLPTGVSYNRNIHYNSQWVDLVIRMFLALFENPDKPLRASHLEDWYTSNVWSIIIDHCLIDIRGMTIERKESSCLATGVRKNRNRTMTGKAHRQKTGRHLDAIIRTSEDDSYEYGGMEVASSFRGGTTSSKWLDDNFKLVKALRDMLFRLHELVDHDNAIVKKLQVVGVLNAGLTLQVTHMNNPNGYVSLLQREKLQHVPTGVQDLMKLLTLLKNVSQMKQIIKDCAAVVSGRQAGKTEAEKYEELMGEEVSDKTRLGWAADSP